MWSDATTLALYISTALFVTTYWIAAPPSNALHSRDILPYYDTPTNRMVINGFMVFEDSFTRHDMIELLATRIVPKHPRMTQYISSGFRNLYWVPEEDFQAENHVWKYAQHVGKDELDQLVGEYFNRDFPAKRSPYEFIVVEDYQVGQSAVIFRFHHSIADGIGFIKMMIDASDEQSKAQVQSAKIGKPPVKFFQRVRKISKIPQAILKQNRMSTDSNPLHGPELSGERRVTSSDPMDLLKLKEIKNQLGCTINDLMMAALAGAFREYFKTQHPEEEIQDVTLVMPLNMRSPAQMKNVKLENAASGVILQLPSATEDRQERLTKTIEMLNRMKDSAEPIATYLAFHLFSVLPHSLLLSKAAEMTEKCTSSVSNVPGPEDPIYYQGHKVERLVFAAPGSANVGVGISILSYAGQVTVAATTDAALSESPNVLTEKFVEEIDRFYDLTKSN